MDGLRFILGLCLLTAPAAAEARGVEVIAFLGTPCRAARHAHVELLELGRRKVADEHGRVALNDLPAGTHRLIVWTTGRPPISIELVLRPAGETLVLIADLESGSVVRVRRAQASRSDGELTDPAIDTNPERTS